MNNLYSWFNTLGRKQKGVPQNADIWLADTSSIKDYKENPIKKEWIAFNPYKDSLPLNQRIKLPEELFLFIRTKNEPMFDWCYTHHHVMVMSEVFLNYFLLSNHEIKKQIEVAKLNIINIDGTKYDKKYFAVRVIKFDDHRFNFNESSVKKRGAGLRGRFIYPEMELLDKDEKRSIYFLREFCYNSSLILTERAKNHILSHFHSPEIYTINDYYLAFNNSLHKEKLPQLVINDSLS